MSVKRASTGSGVEDAASAENPLAGAGDSALPAGPVRIGELSRLSGVAVGTIKFYVREGLVPPGQATSRTQALYDAEHLRRLRLVRVLADVGGLRLAQIKEIVDGLDAADGGAEETLELARLVSYAVGSGGDGAAGGGVREAEDGRVADARAATDAFVDRLGLVADASSPARRALAEALAALRELGIADDPMVFGEHARHAIELGRFEAEAALSSGDAESVATSITVGSLVWGAAFMALRSLAQEDETRRILAEDAGD